jgi:co-chaperonin GroES (HSP10)
MANDSGIIPVEYKVLILPDEVPEKTESGILFRPETAREKEQWAQVRGLLVSVGGNAFEDWKGTIPSPGDRVMFAKYAGIREIDGSDGKKYQVCNDKDIIAVITKEL